MAAPTTTHLFDLPVDTLYQVVRHFDAPTLAAVECTCTTLLQISRQDGGRAWRSLIHRRWGPVKLPTSRAVACTSSCTSLLQDWRDLAQYLETNMRKRLCISVRKTVELLMLQGIISRETEGSSSSDVDINGGEHGPLLGEEWHETLRRLLVWVPLNEKRRIAAFVCADWQSPTTLARFLSPFPVVAPSPVGALRLLLLRFPFLPIDAGAGADRVIGWFARAYVIQNPHHLESLGIGVCARVPAVEEAPASTDSPAAILAADLVTTQLVEQPSDSDDEGEETSASSVLAVGGAASTSARLQRLVAARMGLTEIEFKAARDAVYTLIYSVIMLNTDLHNPAIAPKITADEYVASVHRCVPLASAPDEPLRAIYESIASHPLQIAPRVYRVETSIRSSLETDDTESGATFSIYSHHRAATLAAAAQSVPSALSAGSAVAGAHGAVGHGIVIGGGRPIGAGGSADPELPPIDWNVAYWNLVDGCRYVRQWTFRVLTPSALGEHMLGLSSRVGAKLGLSSRALLVILGAILLAKAMWLRLS
mmetsp:Transcript_9895/g.25517  ORF Transcript_9895/g.25517 Transcript_9895/m.25517 type:complete len:537 (-) Transcript_9895:720-2330(-)|eukprot:CAMPEP_0115847662 /NCGR_PEP_ID=MMETSP0287-20121206/10500_1 /TAXON_ID=412157 /ORGANISM="Chrysochromulina rotalis, Strain UIO044" /LENGTH=536 /DNA_ID=CAMNT_0003301507 /DNA_START=54 /DNA_END=1664 /DNA_ORIENTATION=+